MHRPDERATVSPRDAPPCRKSNRIAARVHGRAKRARPLNPPPAVGGERNRTAEPCGGRFFLFYHRLLQGVSCICATNRRPCGRTALPRAATRALARAPHPRRSKVRRGGSGEAAVVRWKWVLYSLLWGVSPPVRRTGLTREHCPTPHGRKARERGPSPRDAPPCRKSNYITAQQQRRLRGSGI